MIDEYGSTKSRRERQRWPLIVLKNETVTAKSKLFNRHRRLNAPQKNSAVAAHTPPLKGGVWAGTSLFSWGIKPMSIHLQILLIYSTFCFLKASKILNVKVVPNDSTFKFGGGRIKGWLSTHMKLNLFGVRRRSDFISGTYRYLVINLIPSLWSY